jgi:hypothetical protein
MAHVHKVSEFKLKVNPLAAANLAKSPAMK